MALTFRCIQCGKTHTATNVWAGKVINCDGCGKGMRIPTPPGVTTGAGAPVIPRGADPGIARPVQPLKGSSIPGRASRSEEPAAAGPVKRSPGATENKPSLLRNVLSGVVAVVVLFAMVGRFVIRPYRAYRRAQERQEQRVNPQTNTVSSKGQPISAPWTLPALPDPGEGITLEPGIRLHEVHLSGAGGSARKMPGHSGKLWLYLPEGDHAPQSLPCILIAGAGSNLMTGMDLGDADRPEHLPYVRAGFAVLAYELDGRVPDPKPTNDAAFIPYIRSFVAAEAGLINMRVAVEYATTRVPEIDPTRLYAAGHSSAATLTLLVAENEPRIAACVAYAPVVDIAVAIPPDAQQVVSNLVPGAGQLFTRFNPRAGESNIQCPLFLFVAQDDEYAGQIRELAGRLRGSGKAVTLVTVARGGHHEPMLKIGIPRAIAWLKTVHRGAGESTIAPKAGPPNRKINPRRNPGGTNNPAMPGQRRPRTGPG